jgi:CPA2 family monovalent cation:H+ antiporter-2
MPPLLERVARTCSPEVFLLAVVAICFGTAYLTALAGVSVSLGAFLAGLVVSESRHSEHALGEILPLQIIFSATFFVSVGMLLDLAFVVDELPLVLAAVALVVVVKTVAAGIGTAVLRVGAARSPGHHCCSPRIGEFSFVLESVGRNSGLSPAGLGERGAQAFIAATVLLMVATPALAAAGRAVEARTRGQGAPADRGTGDRGAGRGRAARPRPDLRLGAGRPSARDRPQGAVVALRAHHAHPDGAGEAERRGTGWCAATRPSCPCSTRRVCVRPGWS